MTREFAGVFDGFIFRAVEGSDSIGVMGGRGPAMALLLVSCFPACALMGQSRSVPQAALGRRSAPLLTVDGFQFKDLNRNGRLDIYEDWRQSPEARADDLLRQMSVEDMAGTMLHGTLPVVGGPYPDLGIGGSGYDYAKTRALMINQRITTFHTRFSADSTVLAESSNKLQEMAESTGLGIPLILSTDPRHSFQYTAGASVQTGQFSKWPETTGIAAIGDAALARRFGDIVRQEYEAVGIRESLSPQADLATEPRWARINGTFGEDAQVAKAMVEGYVAGIQGGHGGLNARSVIAVVKHWVGYGAQKDGWDSHNYYGRYSSVKDSSFQYHVTPFLGAFDAHVGGVMPTYSILENISLNGKHVEPVGAGMNKELVDGLLRGKYHFDGVVLSDWAITEDCGDGCQHGVAAGQRPDPAGIGMPWGVESLSREDRFARTVNAGVDQIGGSNDAVDLLAAIKDGKISKDRVREATRRILIEKFQIGLFENPYVDAEQAKVTVGSAAFVKEGEEAQKNATVLLQNKNHTLPLHAKSKVYLFGIDAAAAVAHGFEVVDSPVKADVAIIRAETPFELLHPGYFFGLRQHEGRLNFEAGDPAYDALLKCGKTPVVMTVSLDRPAILTEVVEKTSAVLANFGISDTALFDVLSGKASPKGKLPFELPSSMAAVAAQQSDQPHDSSHPLLPYGFGLHY